jgi:FkbM family methyltransferase
MRANWLRNLRPRWLRENIFYKYYIDKELPLELFRKAELDFARAYTVNLLSADVSHKCIAVCGFYGLALSREIKRLADSGGLMVDVGANIGYYSILWAAARPENRVVAFEASPRALSFLERNVTGNSLSSHIDIQKTAVSATSGKSPFWPGPEDQTGWGGLSLVAEEGSIEVSAISLDDFFRDEPQHIDVLKIDVEGADFLVLKGAAGLLKSRRIRNVFFEENSVRSQKLGIKSGAARDLLGALGYRVRKVSYLDYHAAPIKIGRIINKIR